MNRFLILAAAIFSFTCMAMLPPIPASKDKDKPTTKLLKEVSKKYKAYKSLKAEFTMLNEPADAKAPKKTEKGTLITKGNKFKMVFMGEEVFCNGKLIWTYNKELGECRIENYSANANSSLNPSKIFTVWEKGFLYASDGTYKKGKSDIAKIKLTPEDKNKPYFLMNLEIDQTNKTIESMKVSFKAGNRQTYTVTSQVPNGKYEDSAFEFNAKDYPGVEIIDLTKKSKQAGG